MDFLEKKAAFGSIAISFTEGITKWLREIQSKNRGEVECAIILMADKLIWDIKKHLYNKLNRVFLRKLILPREPPDYSFCWVQDYIVPEIKNNWEFQCFKISVKTILCQTIFLVNDQQLADLKRKSIW